MLFDLDCPEIKIALSYPATVHLVTFTVRSLKVCSFCRSRGPEPRYLRSLTWQYMVFFPASRYPCAHFCYWLCYLQDTQISTSCSRLVEILHVLTFHRANKGFVCFKGEL